MIFYGTVLAWRVGVGMQFPQLCGFALFKHADIDRGATVRAPNFAFGLLPRRKSKEDLSFSISGPPNLVDDPKGLADIDCGRREG